MSKYCPVTNTKVLYLDCLECEDKICESKRKERMKNMKVFVCQEENCPNLVSECGSVNQLSVFDTVVKATKWLLIRIKAARKDGFVVDSIANETKIAIINEMLSAGKCVSITMFYERQDNWDRSFDIVIYPKEVL